jgi:alkyl sulfatase BDS1-like metallo-beta-lactamase superfamily hydrolase
VEAEAWERGLYVRAMGTEVVGLAPPLTIDRACADQIVAILAESIAAMEADVLARERAGAARRAARRVESIEQLFAAMASRFDPAKADGVELVVQYALSGDAGGTWIVAIRNGKLSIDRATGEQAGAAATVRADAANYLRIVNGDLSGAEAFSTRQLVIEGDLAQVAKIAELGLV